MLAASAAQASPSWAEMHAVRQVGEALRTTDADSWLVSPPLAEAVPADASCFLLEVQLKQPTTMQVYWTANGEPFSETRSIRWAVPASSEYRSYVVDLNANGTFGGAQRYRLDPADEAGVEFAIRGARFLRPQDVPRDLLTPVLNFRCFTSKLHYRPGEPIEYRAVLNASGYPDRQSSKTLAVEVRNAAGQVVATATQQYGIAPRVRTKEVQGAIEPARPLTPGAYTLKAISTDQRSGLELSCEHIFGVQSATDPHLYETPFKFVKDFSIVRGHDGRWHVFSITGDFFDNHDWLPDGQERTFSHGSSPDLREWTIHAPVISVSDAEYPDGRGRYKDRNVWAPHVIRHHGRYWMFYTSVNRHVSQSISLATSDDLFHWEDHPRNPVFTLEGVEWANWSRSAWADCRDPCVFFDGGVFYLYVTANAKPPGDCGAVAVATSRDLVRWSRPEIAVRGRQVSESPQVFGMGGRYFMTTSSVGAATYASDHPAHGWRRLDFPRPDIGTAEKYVATSPSYAEEVVPLGDADLLMASLTWRHWGNSIYFFRVRSDGHVPVGYDSTAAQRR